MIKQCTQDFNGSLDVYLATGVKTIWQKKELLPFYGLYSTSQLVNGNTKRSSPNLPILKFDCNDAETTDTYRDRYGK